MVFHQSYWPARGCDSSQSAYGVYGHRRGNFPWDFAARLHGHHTPTSHADVAVAAPKWLASTDGTTALLTFDHYTEFNVD